MSKVHYSSCPLCGSTDLQLQLKTKDYSISKEDFEIHKCNSCDFSFTQNVPDANNIGPYYKSEDYISHSNTKKGLINGLYHWARQKSLISKLQLIQGLSKGKKLLDIGCGTGYFPSFMDKHGYEVVGIEPDPDAREFGKKEFGINVESPTHLLEELETSFDIITMWHVLEHVHDIDTYFKKIYDLLSDNGKLIIAVPNYSSKDGQHYGEKWAALDVPRHLWHFTPDTLEKWGSKHKFKLLEKHHMPFDPFYVSMLSEKFKNNSLFFLSGVFHGFRSYVKSTADADKGSSVIYILTKDN